MKYQKSVLIILLTISSIICYSQDNKSDSVNSERESLKGYFFHNDSFCDKLEEFIDIMDFIPGASNKRFPLIFISSSYCEKEMKSLLHISITKTDYFPAMIRPNNDHIFMVGNSKDGISF